MSHHYSGPNGAFPLGDARLDITDLFAFPKPGDADKSIIAMDVHPSTGLNPTGPTMAEPFAPEALYEIRIDTNRDAIADFAYQVRFAPSANGGQTATVSRVCGASMAEMGEGGQTVVGGAPVSIGHEAQVVEAGGYRFFAGWRSDPFFFDAGALDNFRWVGRDLFGDVDVCTIVLEVPNGDLGPQEIWLWGRILVPVDGAPGKWVQVERGALPSQTPFLSGDDNEAYRAAEPTGDARFIGTFAHSLEHLGGLVPEEAKRVAATLLPDVLRYDPTRPAAFPYNGRQLTDDAADAFVGIVTGGKIRSDGIGPHDDLLAEFPYLGPPHDVSRVGAERDSHDHD